MTEAQRALWTMSSPISAEYSNAMQDFNNRSYTTKEQHKESTEARIKRLGWKRSRLFKNLLKVILF
jgi:hypothetical protein